MAFTCDQVAHNSLKSCRRCIGLTSFPKVPNWLACQKMGLGTFYPPRAVGNSFQYVTWNDRCAMPFWLQLSLEVFPWKTSVSCSMIPTVLTNVHITFPIPFISAPSDVLAYVCRYPSRRIHACRLGFKQSVYPQLCTNQLLEMHMRLRSLCSKVVSVVETRHLEWCRYLPVKGTPCLSKRTFTNIYL